jgi:hypothetical protein
MREVAIEVTVAQGRSLPRLRRTSEKVACIVSTLEAIGVVFHASRTVDSTGLSDFGNSSTGLSDFGKTCFK